MVGKESTVHGVALDYLPRSGARARERGQIQERSRFCWGKHMFAIPVRYPRGNGHLEFRKYQCGIC